MPPSQLKIRAMALGRLLKEEVLYKEEVTEHTKTLEKMKSENADKYEIKKYMEVLKDTEKMIPELQKKIRDALDTVKSLLEESTSDDAETLEIVKENIAKAESLLN
ncbi:tubulin-specific chaperone A [Nadsonia fulvescens var. elongata DSM 6958]|uniref:Tubulin-specific chaperone A n=1 Tax=Nadsonia fulvescens var. elongata DSM 6958 TaxID=857566 RepID=A0A1E3PQT4_9ASCO|nr:tubulin-specific chaperone A [Nadsonia fulvescens var. elongata DSM 6958]